MLIDNSSAWTRGAPDPLLQIGRAASTRDGVHFTEARRDRRHRRDTPREGRWTPPALRDEPQRGGV